MKLLGACVYWLLLYWASSIPSVEEFRHFEFYQSCIAASLLIVAYPCIRDKLPRWLFGFTLFLQICINAFHLGSLSAEKYDAMQGLLNAFEVLFLFVFGGFAELRHRHESDGHNRAPGPGRATARQ